MRFSKGCTLVLCMLVAMVFAVAGFAQETTGGLQGTIKDSSGAVLDKATVEVSSSALIGTKKVDTDSAGYYRFANLPPGDYTITVTMKGFKTLKQGGVHLIAGALPSIDLKMEVGGTEQTVEVSAAPPLVDVTQSKVQTNVSGEILDTIPKGRSFQSVIGFAPGARQEPLQSSRTDQGRLNGFQIDGASDAENVYMSEGLNITGIYGGGVGAQVPMEFIQEVQVKSSSFEAEYGGANGGVINAIQKRGGPQWHGSIFTYYRGDPITANDQCVNRMVGTIQGSGCGLRNVPGTSTNTGKLGTVDTATGTQWTSGPFFWNNRLAAPTQYYLAKQDKWSTIEPGFEIGGPLFKDRLWLFSSYVPTLSQVTRSVNFTGANPGPRSFTQTDTTQAFLTRLDYRLSNAVRLFGAWQSGYRRIKGTQGSLNPDSLIGQVNTTAGNDPNTLRADTGSTNPLTILNFGADITLGSKLVITTRYGYFYTDSQDRGKSTGTRYVWQADSTCDPNTDPNSFGCTGGPGGGQLPVANQHTAGFANIPNNFQQVFDIFSRRQFTTDAAYFVGNFGGTHNLKGGYAVQRLAENVLQAFQTSVVNIWYGPENSYTAASGPTATVCANAEQKYGLGGCTGPYGYYVLSDGVTTNGNVSTLNHSFYVQDAWTVHQSLTINGGVRFDKEFLPPYRPGAESISFGFGQKVAPRIGAAYDLFHNGKVKIYGSYGKFFDIMKFSLPRGSFGGDRWHDCAYALDVADYTQIQPQNIAGKFCPDSGQAVGNLPGTFIENQNWRASAPGIASDPIVDPKVHPMQTHEFVAGADWAISPKLAFESRYARKRLDWTIEDMSLDDGQYYIGNPGTPFSQLLQRPLPSAWASEGLPGSPIAVCPDCPPTPKAVRDYDGIELRLIRNGENWGGQFAYTWSRLWGNYAGLNDTYYTDGNGGRHEPNNGRAFDLPNMLYDGQGHVANGPMPTDRPNTINAFGYYRLKWFGMESLIGLSQSFAQGTPQSTCLGTVDSASSCQFVAGQGNWINFTQDPTTADIVQGSIVKGKRSPWLNQTNLNFTHSIHVSKQHEGMLLGFNADISNVFNQRAPMVYQPAPLATGYTTPIGNNVLGWDYKALETNFNYMALMNDKSYFGPGGVGPSVNTNVPDPNKAGFCTDGTAQPCTPDYVALYAGANTNGKPNTLSGTYGKALIFQSARTIRLQLKFTF